MHMREYLSFLNAVIKSYVYQAHTHYQVYIHTKSIMYVSLCTGFVYMWRLCSCESFRKPLDLTLECGKRILECGKTILNSSHLNFLLI